MTTHIALLRGINVGGNNKLPMKDLSVILGGLGYENIKTYIQSGNVVFDTARKLAANEAEKISAAIQCKMGFEPQVLLMAAEQFKRAISHNPYPVDSGKALHFYFLNRPAASPNIDGLEALKLESEKFTLTDTVFYLYAPDGIGRSKLAASVEKLLGVAATARNWNTVEKLAGMTNH